MACYQYWGMFNAATFFLCFGLPSVGLSNDSNFCVKLGDAVLTFRGYGTFDHTQSHSSKVPQSDGSIIFSMDYGAEGNHKEGGSITHNLKFFPRDKLGNSRVVESADFKVHYPIKNIWRGKVLDAIINKDCKIESIYIDPSRISSTINPPFTVNAAICRVLSLKVKQYRNDVRDTRYAKLKTDEDKFKWAKSFSPSKQQFDQLGDAFRTNLKLVIEADKKHIRYDSKTGTDSPWFEVYSVCANFQNMFSSPDPSNI